MPPCHRMLSTCGARVTLLVALVLAGCQAAAPPEPDRGPAIEALGGKVVRNDGLPGQPIISVEFDKVTDAGLKELAGMKYLASLKLAGTEITDAGLKELAGLKSLTDLDLSGTHVTDAGLKQLAALKSLHRISLTGTRVTEAGVEELKKVLKYCTIQQ